jgi:hypothetical protein
VKAQSRTFAFQVDRCETATDLDVRWFLMFSAVLRYPPDSASPWLHSSNDAIQLKDHLHDVLTFLAEVT